MRGHGNLHREAHTPDVLGKPVPLAIWPLQQGQQSAGVLADLHEGAHFQSELRADARSAAADRLPCQTGRMSASSERLLQEVSAERADNAGQLSNSRLPVLDHPIVAKQMWKRYLADQPVPSSAE